MSRWWPSSRSLSAVGSSAAGKSPAHMGPGATHSHYPKTMLVPFKPPGRTELGSRQIRFAEPKKFQQPNRGRRSPKHRLPEESRGEVIERI
ncbi:hypothetical protein EG328_005756 [Venturia inaequalis]|uniref:Uncharacterized protein n=1 Tax=Venturia inaequalis TaxID=5025 RepID=A0A8H3YVD4_VENIN|nr:hypothetical protein EG328_005756 [Venturia inaequalis]